MEQGCKEWAKLCSEQTVCHEQIFSFNCSSAIVVIDEIISMMTCQCQMVNMVLGYLHDGRLSGFPSLNSIKTRTHDISLQVLIIHLCSLGYTWVFLAIKYIDAVSGICGSSNLPCNIRLLFFWQHLVY